MSPVRPRVTRRGARMDWVKFDAELARDGTVDTVDKALYVAIASFVDTDTRESPELADVDPDSLPDDVPTRKRLAECIGKSVDTVDRSTKRLETRGLLAVHRQADPDNPRRMLPSEYELLDHHLWDERAAARTARRQARQMGQKDGSDSSGGGRTGAATPGRTDAATPGRTGAAVKEEREVEEREERETAPSARSAGGVRSTSTSGRGARDAESGCAATGKAGSPSGEAGGVPAQRTPEAGQLTREQTAAVHAVEALLPPLLAALLPYGHIPGRNRAAVLEALESRTVDQLEERIARRWLARSYEPAVHDGELRSAVGAALALIGPTPGCPDPSCEDGELIDTAEECRACLARKAQRRADRLAGRAPAGRTAVAPKDTCADCEHPFPGTAPADGLCRQCREAPAAAVAALATRLEHEAAAQREAEELEQEAQRRRARRAAEATASAAGDSDPVQPAADAEEDARLRAEVLAANPWMADYAQQPATAQGPAPF
ncbi:hypothetical protein [Streptomyces sp. NPDC088736]|uniref:hypothetical protein n=1 Tax=Streptomyces sp. NPDC088736 TaxID=3365881 RepID=UPI0038038326